MSKLPLETRPIRVAPLIAKVLEDRLRPLSGKPLSTAQQAILKVYHSGKQGSHEEWLIWYLDEIKTALKEPEKVTA